MEYISYKFHFPNLFYNTVFLSRKIIPVSVSHLYTALSSEKLIRTVNIYKWEGLLANAAFNNTIIISPYGKYHIQKIHAFQTGFYPLLSFLLAERKKRKYSKQLFLIFIFISVVRRNSGTHKYSSNVLRIGVRRMVQWWNVDSTPVNGIFS